ncbi:unnamed protein product [Phytophthora lilii]|uniref:Unnamed protein product n=1 Tax=Phytophthora lilii TaxID=2077276 RepID=A0A9W6YJG6_9STRA|nr:unnamed protein product [Phytophthora lilii]
MVRSRIAFVFLAVIASTTSTQAIDWTFWNDDDDSTASSGSSALSTGTETLSPEAIKSLMGSGYMDAVRSLIGSGLDDSSSSSRATTKLPTSASPSSVSSASSVGSWALSLSGSSSLDLEPPSESAIATHESATNGVKSTYRNWVGPWSQSADSACYREAHIMDTCPSNYDRNELTNTCWTECPMGYPVECGMQCIQQNNDCGREVAAKISAVAMSALSSASFGLFGELAKLGKKVTWAVNCVNSMLVIVRAIIRFTRNQMTQDPQTSQEKLLLLLYQTSNVVTDLPIAILTCSGKAVNPNLRLSTKVLATAQFILLLAMSYDDDIVSSWGKFKAFMKGANFTEAAEELTEGEITDLESAMKKNSTCGADMRSLTNSVYLTVGEIKRNNPSISEDELRLRMSNSDLVLYDIATVTNNCMSEMIGESSVATAYKTRETLRKTFGVIISDLIEKGKSDNGTSIAARENLYRTVDNTFTLFSLGWDPTDLTTLAAEFLQTICGPTQFMGEIDDGDDDATLGLNALKKAFKNSTSSWTRKGDGAVIINFVSKDTEDVTVNIMSGGDKIDEVDVPAGGTAQWKSNVTALGGKTLYLDRWRPGFLGLPGTGGGSLVLWVPLAREGGHLEIKAQLNVS